MTDESTIDIALLFPNLLGTYGDGGNAVILAKRLAWRGFDARVLTIDAGEPVPESCAIYLLGGGEDGPQTEAARELGTPGPLHRAVDRGAVLFAVCAGMQIVGHHFPDSSGQPVPGLGLLDCETVKTDEARAVGELLVDPEPSLAAIGRLTGFENHGGRTRLGPEAAAIGPVAAGVGNGSGTEGVRNADLARGKVLGTYLHGPALARNPGLADLLISWALEIPMADLAPLDDADHEAALLRRDRFQAVDHGRLDGVATRSWRDRLLNRN